MKVIKREMNNMPRFWFKESDVQIDIPLHVLKKLKVCL